MAEQPDKDSKTEEATPRRIEEARNKGNAPISREVAPFATMLGVVASLAIVQGMIWNDSIGGLAALLDRAADLRLNTAEDAMLMAATAGQMVGRLTVVPLMALMLFGTLAAALQNPIRMIATRIKPDFSRLSLMSGLKKLFGAHNGIDFIKTIIKLCLIMIIGLNFLFQHKVDIINSATLNPHDLPRFIMQYINSLFITVTCVLAIIVLADVFWSRIKWHIDLRMSKQEIKDEHKQSEGDPLVRARQRSLARDQSRRRMIASVPRATVVIANPTHYAVALRYIREESATPIVLAKGLDNIAIRIRELAEQHGIPVIEDKVLARTLYAAVAPDRPIPPEFYRAVAEVVLFLMSKTPRHGTTGR